MVDNIKVGDFISSLNKPGIVVDVFTSTSGEQKLIKLLSADIIARNADHNGGELIDNGYHVNECTKTAVLMSIDNYIGMLKERIEKLEEFKKSILQHSV